MGAPPQPPERCPWHRQSAGDIRTLNRSAVESGGVGFLWNRRRTNDRSELIPNPAVPDTVRREAKPLDFVSAIVDLFVVMAVESRFHLQATRKFIDLSKTMPMAAWRFMGHKDVGPFVHECLIVIGKDGAPMLPWHPATPTIPFSAASKEILFRRK